MKRHADRVLRLPSIGLQTPPTMTASSELLRYHVHPTPTGVDWSRAACLSQFSFPWESTSPPQTEFRALWDDAYFYFRFDCEDADLVLPDGPTLKERVLGSDRVEIFFTPELTLNPYYALEMNPRGEALAYSARYYRQYDWEWSCPGLDLTACLQSGGYRVEGKLPMHWLRESGVLKREANEFYAGVYRAEFSHRADGSVHAGWMPWVNPGTEKPDFHVPSSFGLFTLCS